MKVPVFGQKAIVPAVIAVTVLSIGCVVINGWILPGWAFVGTIELLLLALVHALFAPNWSGMTVRYGIMVYAVTTGLLVVATKHPGLLGEFSPGNALGPYANNVGLLMGLPWFLTLMFSYAIATRLNANIYLRSLIGAVTAIVPTIFILHNSAALDLLYWVDVIPPVRTYITFFIAYFVLHFAGATMDIKSANPIARPLYAIWFGFHILLFAIRFVKSGWL